MPRWAAYQVAGTRRPAAPQVPHGFETFQKPLPGLSLLQTTAVAEPIAHGHVAPLDSLGRRAPCAVQPRSDVDSAWAGGQHGLDVRLVMIGHHLTRDHSSPFDRLPKEGFCTRRVAVLTKDYVDDHTVLVDGRYG
jgi:hypothetical protein